MKKNLQYSALGLACLLAAAVPVQALAATVVSPRFSRSEEEWARLEDNTLEYDEIEDLIHEYNVTVINNRTSYRDYRGDTPSDVAQRYRDAASELRDSIEFPTDPTEISYATMIMAAQTSETMAKNLEKQADNNVDDAQSIYMQYEQVEANLVFNTKQNLISYEQKLLTDQLSRENRKLLEAQYQSAQVQASVGNATQMDVLNTKQAMEQLDSTIISNERDTQTLRQKIALATGWSYNAEPVFGELPVIDLAVTDQIDLEADKAKALEENYTLKINKRKLENSTDAAIRENLEKTIHDNQQRIASDVQTKYQSLLTARASYELAIAEQAIEAQKLAAAALRFQTGTASRLEYQQETYTMQEKDTAVETSKLGFLSAWETYQAAVKGLASADAG